MALITTKYSIGWYGVSSNVDCTDFSLTEKVGTYEDIGGVKTYKPGSLGLTEAQANQLTFKCFAESGSPRAWSLPIEKALRTVAPQGIKLDTLECGQMYTTTWGLGDTLPVDIPGFIPTTKGSDMGRVVPA